jgi:hypothetical protein
MKTALAIIIFIIITTVVLTIWLSGFSGFFILIGIAPIFYGLLIAALIIGLLIYLGVDILNEFEYVKQNW